MKQSGLGIASMVLGIISILLGCVVVGIIPAIVGLILALIALSKKDTKKGTAIAGLICSIVGLLISIVMIAAMGTGATSTSTNNSQSASASVETTPNVSSDVEEKTTDESSTAMDETKETEQILETSSVISPGYSFDADGLEVTITNFDLDFTDYKDDYGLYTLENGMKYIMIEVAYKNNSNSDKYVSIYDFQCYADDQDCEQEYGVVDNSSINANISSGRKSSYQMAFIVPEDAQSIELEYETSIWTGKKEIIKLQ